MLETKRESPQTLGETPRIVAKEGAMPRLFMPSCNNSLVYTRSIQRLGNNLIDRGLVDGWTGCCKPGGPGHGSIPEDADVVTICNSCMAIAEESLNCNSVANAFELILEDDDFDYPDYGGEEITIQDCWRACGRHSLHDAVRELLRRMNLVPVELPENRDKSHFCGVTTCQAMPELNARLAPRRFGNVDANMFVPRTAEERKSLMREHAAQITTPRVASYCFSCDAGLVLGGADSASILNLLFDRSVPL